ncbi:hypothetical protein [Bosea massiliensis]|uniref:SMI1/KNR4 family protein n=1 Tax=Bosea massiliensis TaxID=151419 RepID=A0ABW0P661_9HYPH
MTLILKLHSLSALSALQVDILALEKTAAEGAVGLDAETVRMLGVLLQPVPDAFPVAISVPWDAMALPLRVCLARSHSYNGDAVLYDDAENASATSDIVLSGMTPQHVATLLEAVEQMTTADIPAGILRNDLNPINAPVAGALVDQSILPWISKTVREGFYLARVAANEARAERFFSWLDAQNDSMTPTVTEFAKANSFAVHHTGGGCLALMREEGKDWHVLLTDDDGSLPTDPNSAENYFGIYHNESEWWLSTAATFADYLATRQTIIALAKNRMNPKQDGIHIDLVPLLQLAKELRLVHKDEKEAVAKILSR